MGLGLYLSRLAAESSVQPWRLAWLLPLLSLGLALGLGLTRLLRGREHVWPLYLLWGYVLCPVASLSLGLLLGGGAFLLLVLLNGSAAPKGQCWLLTQPTLPLVVFVASLGLYVATLSPDLLPADAGEFQFIGHVLGIAHPPGYALYTLLNKLATLIPVGSVAYRANLFGALCGAGTLAALAWGVQRQTGSTSAALLSVLFLGLSPTFWVQSTTANIRTLTTCLAALTVAWLWRWGADRSPRSLTLAALALGLGVGHHPSLVVLAPPMLAYVLAEDPTLLRQPRRWLAPLVALVASLAVWLYLPLRSAMQPAFDPDPIRTWSAFWGHVLATGFGGDMLYFRTWPQLAARFGVWWDILRLQFGPVLPLAALASIIPLWRRQRSTLLLLGGLWALNTLLAVTYRAPQTVEYLLPSYLALAALLGLGVSELATWLPRRTWRATLVAIVLLLALLNGIRSLPSLQAGHRDRSTREQSEALLQAAPADALVLANWHQVTALWYLQLVEGQRPDVTVRYVYPEGATANETVWLRRIDEAIAERPVLVTNRFYGYDYRDYRWEPFHGAWLVQQDAVSGPPPEMTPRNATLGVAPQTAQIEILGYTLERDRLSPGDTLSLRVHWRPLVALEHDYTAFAQLLGPQGVVGQGDIAQPTRSYAPLELRTDTYRFPLLLQTPPGAYRLITGFYRTTDAGWERLTTEQGEDSLILTEASVAPGRQPAATLHPLRACYAGGLTLVGYDLDRSVAEETRLYLHVQMATPALTLDPWRSEKREGMTVRLLEGQQALAESALPALSAGQTATLALDLPNAVRRVTVQVLDADGHALTPLGPWHRLRAGDLSLRLAAGPATYVPLGNQMVFIGLSDLPARLPAGASVTLAPQFLALHPLTHDLAVSLGLAEQHGAWELKSDGTPALGAIPTLKWLRGWRLRDPHTLEVPSEAAPGIAVLTLTVYDAFTLEPLHVLDERLVRQGQGITLRLGEMATE
jgi:hypothetical protein